MMSYKVFFLALIAPIFPSAVLAVACDEKITNSLYESCYNYSLGYSPYIIFSPKKEDLIGVEKRNVHFGDSNPYEENIKHQGVSLTASMFKSKKYRNYLEYPFREEGKLPADRRVRTDVLQESSYKRMLLMSRSMAPLAKQGHLFSMLNVVPAKNPVISMFKKIDEQVARTIKDSDKEGRVWVYSGAISDKTSKTFTSRNTFGLRSQMMQPAAYFKFWYVERDNKTVPLSVGGYIIPNKDTLKPLSRYRAKISQIEHLTGLSFNLKGYEGSYKEEKVKRLPVRRVSSGPITHTFTINQGH